MSSLEKTIIKISQLEKSYVTRSESLPVLKGVDFVIQRNDIISIMGPSGSGKSTLLNIIGLLDQFDAGNYSLSGLDVSSLTKQQMQEIRLKKIGFIFQTFNLIQTLTVRQNIELPMALLHKNQEEVIRSITCCRKELKAELHFRIITVSKILLPTLIRISRV